MVPGGTKTIDATGKLVMPGILISIVYYYFLIHIRCYLGGIDTNTHLEATTMGIKSVDDFTTGTRAAIVGGTTTIRMYTRGVNRIAKELTITLERQ